MGLCFGKIKYSTQGTTEEIAIRNLENVIKHSNKKGGIYSFKNQYFAYTGDDNKGTPIIVYRELTDSGLGLYLAEVNL